MNSPILVSGDDLDRVCADIRARGGVVSALETGVGKRNSQYRVSYFQGDPEREARNEESAPRTPENGSNPLASTNFERVSQCPGVSLAATVQDQPAALTFLPNQCKPPEIPEITIEARMERIRLKAIENGRVTKPSRFKPMCEARLPHNSD